jgi:hypothetical protein
VSCQPRGGCRVRRARRRRPGALMRSMIRLTAVAAGLSAPPANRAAAARALIRRSIRPTVAAAAMAAPSRRPVVGVARQASAAARPRRVRRRARTAATSRMAAGSCWSAASARKTEKLAAAGGRPMSVAALGSGRCARSTTTVAATCSAVLRLARRTPARKLVARSAHPRWYGCWFNRGRRCLRDTSEPDCPGPEPEGPPGEASTSLPSRGACQDATPGVRSPHARRGQEQSWN